LHKIAIFKTCKEAFGDGRSGSSEMSDAILNTQTKASNQNNEGKKEHTLL